MLTKIDCVWEHNGNDTLLYASNFHGAFTRGENLQLAISKMSDEITAFCKWSGEENRFEHSVEIAQECASELDVKDADSDVIFESEKGILSIEEYCRFKSLAMKSAYDFQKLYDSVPDKNRLLVAQRKTFYGLIPSTADEIYTHTKNVNSYYFGEIGIDVDNAGTIMSCREKGFQFLEKNKGFLNNTVVEGSYDELWSLKKVIRRFIWHDRIHAKAMYRGAVKAFGASQISNSFFFSELIK